VEPRSSDIVLAAGGVVIRLTDDEVEVAVIHRPARGDWTFPKGKVERGETLTACALREVTEETGLHCRLGAFVGTTEYEDRKGRRKVVAYWAMVVEGGTFRPNEEVDELRWVPLDEAPGVLSYERDADLAGWVRETSPWRYEALRPSA
jgi:8-oxo-dGTP pyrophosphatase MutT (NUDIX family)